MKIGFQIERLDPARGGAETYVHRFASDLLAAGHEVHLFASAFASEPAGTVTHHVLTRGLTRWTRDLRFARAAGRAAGRANLDVVVATGRTFGATVLQPHGGTLLGSRRQNLLLLGSPILRAAKQTFDLFNPRIRTQLHIEATQYNANPEPDIIAISRMVERDMRELYGVHDDRLHLVYNGVDLAAFSPDVCAARRARARHAWGLAEETVCYLIVAHNFRLKGVHELIEAAARLDRRAPWQIVVVGRGNPLPFLAVARQLDIADRVLFAGPMADVTPAYAAADVYVQPTWYDPCSLVVLEALACGRPVITTRFNGAGELMQDGRDGFVIDSPADTERLAHAMLCLLDNRFRTDMGVAARATAADHSIERNFREMMAVFTKAAARKEAEQ
jgi:UDP-glucose:(heptosyl)LPS alpha-1,3-glucosyltransferase